MTKEGPSKLQQDMTVQEAIQMVVNCARNSMDDNQSNGYLITACEKLEVIFRLTLKRKEGK